MSPLPRNDAIAHSRQIGACARWPFEGWVNPHLVRRFLSYASSRTLSRERPPRVPVSTVFAGVSGLRIMLKVRFCRWAARGTQLVLSMPNVRRRRCFMLGALSGSTRFAEQDIALVAARAAELGQGGIQYFDANSLYIAVSLARLTSGRVRRTTRSSGRASLRVGGDGRCFTTTLRRF